MDAQVDNDISIVDIPLKMGPYIRFQIFVFCYLNNLMTRTKPGEVIVSDTDIACMTVLGMVGQADLTEFCNKIVELKIFKSTQACRNALDRLEDKGLVIKEGTSRKKLYLSPVLNIQNTPGGMIEYRLMNI